MTYWRPNPHWRIYYGLGKHLSSRQDLNTGRIDRGYLSGSAICDRNTKADTYAARDIKERWLVDETFETIEVRHQTGKDFDAGVVFSKDEKLNSSVLADLSLAVSQVFEE
jgi:hypothetical protein